MSINNPRSAVVPGERTADPRRPAGQAAETGGNQGARDEGGGGRARRAERPLRRGKGEQADRQGRRHLDAAALDDAKQGYLREPSRERARIGSKHFLRGEKLASGFPDRRGLRGGTNRFRAELRLVWVQAWVVETKGRPSCVMETGAVRQWPRRVDFEAMSPREPLLRGMPKRYRAAVRQTVASSANPNSMNVGPLNHVRKKTREVLGGRVATGLVRRQPVLRAFLWMLHVVAANVTQNGSGLKIPSSQVKEGESSFGKDFVLNKKKKTATYSLFQLGLCSSSSGEVFKNKHFETNSRRVR